MTERMKIVGDDVVRVEAAILYAVLFNYEVQIPSRTMMTSAVCDAGRRWSPGKRKRRR